MLRARSGSYAAVIFAIACGGFLLYRYIVYSPPHPRVVQQEPAYATAEQGQVIDDSQGSEPSHRTNDRRVAASVPEPTVSPSQIDHLKLYKEYRTAASSGDPDAAFVLLTVLDDCRGVSQTGAQLQKRLRQLAESGQIKSVADRTNAKFRQCQPLVRGLSNIESEYQHWYKAVKEMNHPLLLVRQRNKSYEETRSLVLLALAHDYPEDFLYHDAFVGASRLYTDFPATKAMNERYFYAWQLLSCATLLQCDHDNMRQVLRDRLSGDLFNESVATEQHLWEAIERGDLEGLGI